MSLVPEARVRGFEGLLSRVSQGALGVSVKGLRNLLGSYREM